MGWFVYADGAGVGVILDILSVFWENWTMKKVNKTHKPMA